MFLAGNFIVALLASVAILLPALYESKTAADTPTVIIDIKSGILTAAMCYALFAFIATFLREIVKDMQDIQGDSQDGCKTIPIVFGITKTKILLTIVVLLLLIYEFSFAKFFPSLQIKYVHFYIYFLLMLPLLLILFMLWWSKEKKHFGILSNALKLYMLMGVSTMFYFIYVSGAASYLFVQYLNYLKRSF
jgi:4-hydroxybenzoate polyprenyltransferase